MHQRRLVTFTGDIILTRPLRGLRIVATVDEAATLQGRASVNNNNEAF
jgi:hypothetical protein